MSRVGTTRRLLSQPIFESQVGNVGEIMNLMRHQSQIMNHSSAMLKGTIRGKTIELEQSPNLPDGSAVSVTLLAESASGQGLRRVFGAWADGAEGLDGFLERARRDRKQDRLGPAA